MSTGCLLLLTMAKAQPLKGLVLAYGDCDEVEYKVQSNITRKKFV